MRKFLLSALGASALAIAACNGENSAPPLDAEDPGVGPLVPGGEGPGPVPGGEGPGPTPGEEGPLEPDPEFYEFRMKGESTVVYEKLSLPIQQVEAYYYKELKGVLEPVPVPVVVVTDEVDLANSLHSPLVAYLYPPPDAELIQVSVTLKEALGVARNGGEDPEVDTKVAPLVFMVTKESMEIRKRFVFDMNLDESLVKVVDDITKVEKMLLLPNGNVRY